MTAATLAILTAQKAETEKKIADMGHESEGGHARSSYHDDAGFENEKNRTLGKLLSIGDLTEASIIKPRSETDTVGVGNKIKARFIEEGSEETIYLLGEDDVIRRGDLAGTIVSALSPLGLAIIGRAKNDTVEVKIGSSKKIHVRVLDIQAGDF